MSVLTVENQVFSIRVLESQLISSGAMMKKITKLMIICGIVAVISISDMQQVCAQEEVVMLNDVPAKARSYTAALQLRDTAKIKRVESLISTHINQVREWHNAHPASSIPEGINPVNGMKLSELDRQIIADSAMPSLVHETLMTGLRKELNEAQVEVILDKYTVGKVAATINSYKAIIPNLSVKEEGTILAFLKEAREMAIDYKSMKQISAIFEIYKSKVERYLDSNGRNWLALYQAYTQRTKQMQN